MLMIDDVEKRNLINAKMESRSVTVPHMINRKKYANRQPLGKPQAHVIHTQNNSVIIASVVFLEAFLVSECHEVTRVCIEPKGQRG